MHKSSMVRAIVCGAVVAAVAGAQPVSLGAMAFSSSVGGAITMVAVERMPFDSAHRLTVPQKTDPAYSIQARVAANSTLDSGKAALVRYYVRSASAQPCSLGFRFEQSASPWTGSYDAFVTATQEWRSVTYVFLIKTPSGVSSYAPGESAMSFRLGFSAQILDIGGIEMTLHDGSALDSLEAVAAMSRDTTWRAEARQRVVQNRTGAFIVRVSDQTGAPVPGAAIQVAMTRHDFDFGLMLDEQILGTGTDDLQYAAHARLLGNAATQRIYWAWNWTTEQAIRDVFRILDWADSCGMRSRGHAVVYPAWWACPTWLRDYEHDAAVLRDTISAHIIDCAQRLEGRLTDWDVVNEMSYWTELSDAVGGRQYFVDWYKLAKVHAPSIRTVLNEFGNIENGAMDRAAIDAFKELIRYFIDNGAPVEELGFQGHFDSYTEPDVLRGVLDEFAAFGRPLRVTELDINMQNEQVQASVLYDLLLSFYSHPAMVGVTLWGFWEGNMWNDRRGLVRRDWSRKPSFDVWRDLVYTQWWTPVQNLSTVTTGAVAFSGYYGSYDVRVTYGGFDTTVSALFFADTDSLRIELPLSAGAPGPHPSRSNALTRTVLRNRNGAVLGNISAASPATLFVLDLSGRELFRKPLRGESSITLDIRSAGAVIVHAGIRGRTNFITLTGH